MIAVMFYSESVKQIHPLWVFTDSRWKFNQIVALHLNKISLKLGRTEQVMITITYIRQPNYLYNKLNITNLPTIPDKDIRPLILSMWKQAHVFISYLQPYSIKRKIGYERL